MSIIILLCQDSCNCMVTRIYIEPVGSVNVNYAQRGINGLTQEISIHQMQFVLCHPKESYQGLLS